MFIVVVVIVVPLFGISIFHLLWLLPVAWVVGALSLAFPFSLVSLVGTPFGRLCCLGLDRSEVERNTRRVEAFRLLLMHGESAEEANRQLDAIDQAVQSGASKMPRLDREGGEGIESR